MKIIGPIESNDKSHMFSANKFVRKPLDLEKYGFVEEEYFIENTANVYDLVDGKVVVYKKDLAYRTRIIVRRPKKDFSNRCYVDIMNASNGYDIEDLWRRYYQNVLENKHTYVGITTKPINVQSLKNFDFDRYKSLNWSNGEVVNMPSVNNPDIDQIEGCEEGLVWDIIRDVGLICKENLDGFLGHKPEYIYLSGQSQSGIYINTYINYMHNFYKENNIKNLYDGYFSLASGGLTRALRQIPNDKMMSVRPNKEDKIDVPVITVNTECDYNLFLVMDDTGLAKSSNSDDPNNLRRYYEISSAAHTDAASPLVPENSEIEKTKNPRRKLDGEYDFTLNNIPVEYHVNALFDRMHEWASEKKTPPIVEDLKRDKNGFKRDEFGHALGGIRSPFIEVPVAYYKASVGVGETNGQMEYFSKEKLKEIYETKENYLDKFKSCVENQIKIGLLTKKDGNRAINRAREIEF